MFLRLPFLRLFPRREAPRSVELEPLDQCLLLTLRRFGDCTFARLQAETEATLGATPARTVLALARLETEGLLGRHLVAGAERQRAGLWLPGREPSRRVQEAQRGRAAVYRLTRSGVRVAGWLPAGLQSRVEVRV